MNQRIKHHRIHWALIGIILLGFGLRLYHLHAVPLRGDEAFAALYWAGLPLKDSLSTIITIEPFPPLNYVAHRIWGVVFGIDSPFALRMLPVLGNVVGVAVLYALGKRLGGKQLGLVAAFLWAIHPNQIWHAQDVRPYALWATLSGLSLWLGLRLIARRKRLDWVLYGLIAIITALYFYTELFFIGTLGLYVLVTHWRRDRNFVLRFLGLQIIAISVAFLSYIIFQGSLVGSSAYDGNISALDPTLYLTWFLPAFTIGDTLPQNFLSWIWPLLVGGFIGAMILLWRWKRTTGLLLGMLALLPPIALGIVSLKVRVFHPRYVLGAEAAFILIFAAGIVVIYRRKKWASLLIIGLWVSVAGVSLWHYHNDPAFKKSVDWPTLARYLQEHTTDNDFIIQQSIDAAFGYYYQRAGIEAEDTGLPTSSSQPEEEIIQTLENAYAQYHSIWVIARPYPAWTNGPLVEQWLDEHMQRVRHLNIDGVPVRQFLPWNVREDELYPEAAATYGQAVELVGAKYFMPPTRNGEIIVWLYWKPIKQTEEPLTVFVHLIGDINPITGTPLWSQDDHPPQNGRISTQTWDIGRVYRDVFYVPLDGVQAGSYTLQVGLYNAATGERVLTSGGLDTYSIGEIQLD